MSGVVIGDKEANKKEKNLCSQSLHSIEGGEK